MKTTITVVMRERFCRELIVRELNKASDFIVISDASRPDNLSNLQDLSIPDVMLIEMSLTNNCELINQVLQQYPELVIVVMGVSLTEKDIVPCAISGVKGYVHDESSTEEIAGIIRCALKNEIHDGKLAGVLNNYLCQSVKLSESVDIRINRIKSEALSSRGENRFGLTNRECQIVKFIDAGLSNKDIARELNLEISTIKNHVHNILSKLKVNRRSEAAAVCRLIDPESSEGADDSLSLSI